MPGPTKPDQLLDQWSALYERAALKLIARRLTPAQQRHLIHLAQAWLTPRRWWYIDHLAEPYIIGT